MKKNKLFLIPASLVLLTGCSGANTELPSGYKKVDTTNEANTEAFFTKFIKDVMKTSDKEAEGSKITGKFSFDEFSYFDKVVYSPLSSKSGGENSFKIKDFSFEYTCAMNGNEADLQNAEIMYSIENLEFDLEVNSPKINGKMKARDIDIYIYETKGNMYIDLSDSDIKKAVDSGLDMLVKSGLIESANKRTFSDLINVYLDKLVIKNADGLGEMASSFVSADTSGITKGVKITDKEIKEMAAELSALYDTKVPDFIKSGITLADYEGSDACAIGFSTKELLDYYKELTAGQPKDPDHNEEVKGDLAAAIVFGEDGIFERFGFGGDFSMKAYNKLSSYEEQTNIIIDDLDFSFKIEYKKQKIKFPNFDDYASIDLDAVTDLLD